MKNKLFTITAAALNGGTVTTDITFPVVPTNVFPRNQTFFPKDFLMINNSGVTIRYIFLNQQEFEEYSSASPPAYYDKIPVAAGATISGHVDGAYRLIMEKVSGVATGDVLFYGLKYISP